MTDETECIMNIGAIIGGDESHALVRILAEVFSAWAIQGGGTADMRAKSQGYNNGLIFAQLAICAPGAWSTLRAQAGVHTMIRVPDHDLDGRRHMSCAGVSVSLGHDAPLLNTIEGAEWGDEVRRYVLDPEAVVILPDKSRVPLDPVAFFAGDLTYGGKPV